MLHRIVARALAVQTEVVRLDLLAPGAAKVLKLVRDDSTLDLVDHAGFDGVAVILRLATLTGPRLVLNEELGVATQVEVCERVELWSAIIVAGEEPNAG